jgi:hypothetical protein
MAAFGYSVGDFLLLTQLAYTTVQNARKACGVHDNLVREVNSLHIVLQRLSSEASKPDSLLKRSDDNRRKELATLVCDCRRVLEVLKQILEKYNALSEEKRGVTKLWQKIRFGNGEMQDLDKIRGEMGIYTQAITLFLNLLAVESQGKVEAYMDSHGKELKEIKQGLHWIIASQQTKEAEGSKSILTTYKDDEKEVWKAFRRELIKEGISSQELGRHKKRIMRYVIELGDMGVLDEVVRNEGDLNNDEGPSSSTLHDESVLLVEKVKGENALATPRTGDQEHMLELPGTPDDLEIDVHLKDESIIEETQIEPGSSASSSEKEPEDDQGLESNQPNLQTGKWSADSNIDEEERAKEEPTPTEPEVFEPAVR